MNGNEVSEADLVRRAKAGDETAFAEIFERHYDTVYRYILYRLNDAQAAEDVASDVFVRMVERIDRFRYRGRPVLAWLYTIARHKVIDYQRRGARRPVVALRDTDIEGRKDEGWSEGAALTGQVLAGCLEGLTESQRQVVLLKFIEGYRNEEVARLLGKPVGAVKSLQHRALAALRRCIDDGVRR